MPHKVKIEKGSVQETLMLPLYAKAWCRRHYPDIFGDCDAERIIGMIDWDDEAFRRKEESPALKIAAVAAGTRQYAIACELKDYTSRHPEALLVNLGCGLDTTGRQADTGRCHLLNIDFPNVIALREELLPSTDRERNMAADLATCSGGEPAFLDAIPADAGQGAAFFACGVFLYLRKSDVKRILQALARRFPGGRIVFDAQNPLGASFDRKTLRKAGIRAGTNFSLRDPEAELSSWSSDFASVRSRGMSTGYLRPGLRFGPVYWALAHFADWSRMSQLNVIDFKG